MYAQGMRTRTLRVTVGAYSDGTWHVALTTDEYERGVLRDSQLITLTTPTTAQGVRWAVRQAVDHLIALEEERVELGGGAEPGQDVATTRSA